MGFARYRVHGAEFYEQRCTAVLYLSGIDEPAVARAARQADLRQPVLAVDPINDSAAFEMEESSCISQAVATLRVLGHPGSDAEGVPSWSGFEFDET